jgi:hypothetical protein
LPEAVGALRETRRKPRDGNLVSVCGADPLNLVGILTPGARLPALTSTRVLYQGGVPIAVLVGGEMQLLNGPTDLPEWQLRLALLGRPWRHEDQHRDAMAIARSRRVPDSGSRLRTLTAMRSTGRARVADRGR